MTNAQAPNPQQLAEESARRMWAADQASQGLGIDVLAVAPGEARLAMTVTARMTNGHGNAHGGFIFALADSAFALACNAYGETVVAAHCAITYLRPGKLGERLVASAKEVARQGRSGIYDVSVAGEHGVVAEFRGQSRRIADRPADG